MNELAILTECYVDTILAESVVPPARGGYNHQHNCQKVVSVMQKKFTDDFAIGIIDKDKKAVSYLSECFVVSETKSLMLHKHKTRHHYIIQLVPAAERFILNAAKSINYDLQVAGLANDLEGLQNHTKHILSKKDGKLKSAFWELKDSPNFALLRKWIEYLKEKEFDADIEELKSMK